MSIAGLTVFKVIKWCNSFINLVLLNGMLQTDTILWSEPTSSCFFVFNLLICSVHMRGGMSWLGAKTPIRASEQSYKYYLFNPCFIPSVSWRLCVSILIILRLQMYRMCLFSLSLFEFVLLYKGLVIAIKFQINHEGVNLVICEIPCTYS